MTNSACSIEKTCQHQYSLSVLHIISTVVLSVRFGVIKEKTFWPFYMLLYFVFNDSTLPHWEFYQDASYLCINVGVILMLELS